MILIQNLEILTGLLTIEINNKTTILKLLEKENKSWMLNFKNYRKFKIYFNKDLLFNLMINRKERLADLLRE